MPRHLSHQSTAWSVLENCAERRRDEASQALEAHGSVKKMVRRSEKSAEPDKRKQLEFFELAARFRETTDAEEITRLGNELGRLIFHD